MKSTFVEADTEVYYDQQDSLYQSFWDKEGSLHWGYFDLSTTDKPEGFVAACQRWNEHMLSHSGINADSKVLDVGSGNGNTAIWMAQKTGCQVTGIDLSQVRVDNARNKAAAHLDLRINFEKISATELPFADGSFTHVWSQATLYHVHDRTQALAEIHRVLEENGIFVFDDLVTPVDKVSEMAQQYVYSRLMFTPTYTIEGYKDCLTDLGIMIMVSEDLSPHLLQSYTLLSDLARPDFPQLSMAYDKMCEAIKDRQVGWAFYCGQKVSDTLSWVYADEGADQIDKKYDAWAGRYDQQLNDNYRFSPNKSARLLATVLNDKHQAILDVGAGTGMVGEALNKLGYDNITALDVSANMLAEAEKKQVYLQLVQQDLADDLSHLGLAHYDALIAVGVLTFNHAPISALLDLNDLLKDQGYVLLTVREDYLVHHDGLHGVFADMHWELLEHQKFNIFDKESMIALLLQKQLG